jgi:hypothetical protein
LKDLYTNPGTGTFQPNGQPLYDGTQTTWVKEENESFSIYGQSDSIKISFKSRWFISRLTAGMLMILILSVYDFVPVELVSFTASASSDKVTLNWSTASETNNRGFEVEREKSDGREVYSPQFASGELLDMLMAKELLLIILATLSLIS